MGCEENRRIELLKEVASKINPEKTQIVFLFGYGNNPKAIRQFALINGWNELPISVGVIKDLDENRMDDYYSLFHLDIGPRTFILNKKGDVIFAENLKNSNSVNLNLLLRRK